MNQILYSEKVSNNSNKKVFIIIAALIVIILITIIMISTQINGKILANVYVGDVDVGFKTKEEAISVITPKVQTFEGKKIKLTLGDKNVDITDEDIGFCLENDITKIIDDAYNYGRESNFFVNATYVVKSYFKDTVITPTYKVDDEKLSNVFYTLSSEETIVASDDRYEISGDKIYIHKGSDGLKIDEELAKKYIITAFINDVNSIDLPTVDGISKRIDLDKIYDEVYMAPQNASFSTENGFEVVIEKNGKNFDLANAKETYNNLKENEGMTIEIQEVEAEIKVADLQDELFSNVLATLSTTYDESDKDRVQNLKVASERCNNTILYPGDEFSYNKALGTRTIANGFAPGHSFAGGKVVTTIGGGICQVSSTLYNVVLMADLEVTNRVAHGMYVEYVKPSLDATVVDGAIDFKFKNNRKYPVKIEATAENGIVKVSLLGLKDENEPIIEIESVILETLEYKTVKENDSTMKKGTTKIVQEPVNGYRSEAYRIVKDSAGNEISRTLISKDKYIPTNEIIKVGTKEDKVVVTPTPVVTPEPTPTQTPEEPKKEESELPPGWDSPESPYGKGE